MAQSSSRSTQDGADLHELPEGFDKRYKTKTRPYRFLEPPAAVKQLFSHFPLQTRPAELRPLSSLPDDAFARAESDSQPGSEKPPTSGQPSNLHLDLWLRSDSPDARTPSFDVDSLRYQTFLRARGVHFGVRVAQPEAAPDGRLPFLMATTRTAGTGGSGRSADAKRRKETGGSNARHKTSSAPATRSTLIRQGEIQTFVALREKKQREKRRDVASRGVESVISINDDEDSELEPTQEERVREQLGISLIEQRIRPAWLYAVYIRDGSSSSQRRSQAQDRRGDSADSVVSRFYTHTATSGFIARVFLGRETRSAATNILSRFVSSQELALAQSSAENAALLSETLNGRAAAATEQLVKLLGDDTFFSGTSRPGYLDAALFAYTHLLLEHEIGDNLRELTDGMVGREETLDRIKAHERAVFARCFGRDSVS